MSGGKEQWGSRIGVILAVAGSAVGLGNFLRFPGNAAENGGGAFMIPYFCALLFLGIPIGWAEWAMGRYGGRKGFHSAPAIMGVFGKGPAGRYVGVIGVLIPVVVYFYYVIIESWCLAYFWRYLTGGIGIDKGQPVADQVATSQKFFEEISGSGIDGVTVGGDVHLSLVFWVLTFSLNIYFVWRGLSKGVEWVCKWAMPTMAVIAIVVLVRVLTLGTPDPAKPDQSVVHGLGFMWNPDFSKLGDFKTWLAAAGQIFFSLSVGFGVILNYASYMRKKDDVVLSGLTASATNEFFEVALGGLITVTAAVVFLGVATTSAATGSSFNLGFNTLPVVFARMPAGDFFGAIWFLMLFLAAITSSLSMLQPAAAFVMEALGLERRKATAVVAIGCLAGSFFVLWFSRGLVALDTLDFWVGSFMIFIMAAAQIICFGWVFGLGRGIREAHEGAHLHIPKFFQFVIKYVAPVYLIVIFVGFCTRNLPAYIETILDHDNPGHKNAQLAWLVIGAVVALLVTVTALGARRWRAQGLDLDGQRDADDILPGSTAPAQSRGE